MHGRRIGEAPDPDRLSIGVHGGDRRAGRMPMNTML